MWRLRLTKVDYFIVTLLIMGGIAALLAALYYGSNGLVHHYLKPRYSTIAENVHVANEWSEFSTEKPERRGNEHRNIYMVVPGYKVNWEDEDFHIKLGDGTVVNPQIQVLDEEGRVYKAEDATRWGNMIGLTLRNNNVDGEYLSHERELVTVRIRSDVPFVCLSIGWLNKRRK